jgi:hypothetical protein
MKGNRSMQRRPSVIDDERSDDAFMVRCYFCGKAFRMGPHVYNGKHISRYKVDACSGCYKSNWDGWAPRFEEGLVRHLQANGLPVPEMNEKGLLSRD